MSVGLIPSSDLGNFEQIFFKRRTMKPATKPAAIPPRNPETVLPDVSPTNPNLSRNPENPARLSFAHI